MLIVLFHFFILVMTTSIEELRALVAQSILSTEAFKNQLAASQEAADRRAEEADRRFAKSKAEADRRSKEIDKQLRELGKQTGGLGNKFGRFTEGMALPSVQKLLYKRFGVEDFMPRRRKRGGGETIELDALGVVNGNRNEAYIVEIKSHLRSDALEQMRSLLDRFRSIFTEYQHMKLYGVIVAGDSSAEALHEARQAGFYVISFDDNIMHFHDDNGFVPKAY
ncbi:MAG: DUF3782 domain-containing protein [Candidatus Kapaibacterium sp.]|nr:MAG: DUF3782 domain-containing protein [Candidatus Kapabacteria bacterium]